ncbi:MAG: glycosyltransferase, partial [Ruegeria sp.]
LNAARVDPDVSCVQFRHDDDDAVSVDFVERMRQTVAECKGFLQNHHTVALDFNRGFTAEMSADGIAAKEEVRPFLGVALGMWVRGGSPLTIMNFGHHKIANFMPVISQTDAPMWVRTQNRFNDSQARRGASADLDTLTPELEAEFEARFAIQTDQVRAAFSELSRSF